MLFILGDLSNSAKQKFSLLLARSLRVTSVLFTFHTPEVLIAKRITTHSVTHWITIATTKPVISVFCQDLNPATADQYLARYNCAIAYFPSLLYFLL